MTVSGRKRPSVLISRQKRKTLVLARLLAGLESEARRERPWEPRKAYKISPGRV
jgi:hypothetical protein